MNKSTAVLLAPLLTLSVMGFGCNPFAGVQEKINQKIGETVAEKIIEAGSGGKLDVEAEGGGFSFKDPKTGEVVSLGTNVKIPAGFPTDIPVYQDAKPSIASLSSDKMRAVLAVTVFGVEPKDLIEWYDSRIVDNGYTRKTTAPTAESLFSEYRKDDAKMIVAILGQKTDDGTWAASVQITREVISQ